MVEDCVKMAVTELSRKRVSTEIRGLEL